MSQVLLDERVLGTLLAAALSALVAVALWMGNNWWERRQAEIRRQEKTNDLMRALLAEIEAYVYLLALDDLDALLAVMTSQMQSASRDRPFVPVVPRESHDSVYRAFLAEIHILPGEVVNPVVRYYNQISAIANFAADMSTDRFAGISGDRMAAMYRHFIVMKQIARKMGERARRRLRDKLDLDYEPFTSPVAAEP